MRSISMLSLVPLALLIGCGDFPDRPGTPTQGDSIRSDDKPRDGDEALAWLLEGNARFAEDRSQHPHAGARRRAALTEAQHPGAVVLGCADSRVPPELVFDAGFGDLFVIRVAGNLASDDEVGSIEYAVEHLDVPIVLVLGHEGCGAVTAALGATEGEVDELSRLLDYMKPALGDIDPSLPEKERVRLGVEANVRYSVGLLEEITKREIDRHGTPTGFRIVGGVYELETGRVRILEPKSR